MTSSRVPHDPMPSPKKLGDLIDTWMRRRGSSGRLQQAFVENAWNDLIGPELSRQVKRVRFVDGTLYLEVRSSVWRHELFRNREAWRERLNETLRSETVRRINVR